MVYREGVETGRYIVLSRTAGLVCGARNDAETGLARLRCSSISKLYEKAESTEAPAIRVRSVPSVFRLPERRILCGNQIVHHG